MDDQARDPTGDLERPQRLGVEHERPARARLWYLLLIPPYVGLLWVPIYAKADPELFGFPFFYWYQFAWVPLTAVLTWIVYRMVR